MATPAARTTFRASAVTSGPMPSPPMTAMRCCWLFVMVRFSSEEVKSRPRRDGSWAHVVARRALGDDDYRREGAGHSPPVSSICTERVNPIGTLDAHVRCPPALAAGL